jgi:hypothetical protein
MILGRYRIVLTNGSVQTGDYIYHDTDGAPLLCPDGSKAQADARQENPAIAQAVTAVEQFERLAKAAPRDH